MTAIEWFYRPLWSAVSSRAGTILLGIIVLGVLPILLAVQVFGVRGWDLSLPFTYVGGDDVWQLVLTKMLHETGWVLSNPNLGAPAVASWHHNASAQTSALHSVLMLALSPFFSDAVQLQQAYYLLNFPLICFATFMACRLLGMSRLVAACIGLIFSFTTFRLTAFIYAFLSNYFAVPLALVAVIWVMTGRFANLQSVGGEPTLRRTYLAALVRDRQFLYGLSFVLVITAADGYYAFFTLLLLGFAFVVRLACGDWRRPAVLVPIAIYIAALMVAALALQIPLQSYKRQHQEEFAPDGVMDPSLIKHSFEAEVYASSLKRLIAPQPNHRIAALADTGRWMIQTSEDARSFKTGPALVPLGTLCSVILLAALTGLVVPAVRRKMVGHPLDQEHLGITTTDALLALTLFILLCSFAGGIGSLVALVYPTIRGYDRFPLFLLFVLLVCGGRWITSRLAVATGWRHFALAAGVVFLTAGAIWDQLPSNASRSKDATHDKFLAERMFVHGLQQELPHGSMIFNFPHSQYLRDSRHYGWGSFSHVRLYLHSTSLRWSNGGAKNSPGDDWLEQVSQLPPTTLITEIEAAGFQAMVIDSAVLKPAEYAPMKRALAERGYEVREDPKTKLAFVRLRDPGYRITYAPSYKEALELIVSDVSLSRSAKELPRVLHADRFRTYLQVQQSTGALIVRRSEHPTLFRNPGQADRGLGRSRIEPAGDMQGSLACQVIAVDTGPAIELTLTNRSEFDWKLDSGSYPLRIGLHVRADDGSIVEWDNGYRVPAAAYLPSGASETVRVPVAQLQLPSALHANTAHTAEFALVQDGHRWFGDIRCELPSVQLR